MNMVRLFLMIKIEFQSIEIMETMIQNKNSTNVELKYTFIFEKLALQFNLYFWVKRSLVIC